MCRVGAVQIAALSLALAGCSSKASEIAEREYQMMKRAGASAEQKCAKRKEIAEAYLKEGNERGYRMAEVEAGLECNRVLLDSLRR